MKRNQKIKTKLLFINSFAVYSCAYGLYISVFYVLKSYATDEFSVKEKVV